MPAMALSSDAFPFVTGQPLIAHIGLQSQGFIPTRPQGGGMLKVSAVGG